MAELRKNTAIGPGGEFDSAEDMRALVRAREITSDRKRFKAAQSQAKEYLAKQRQAKGKKT